jgi:hypothetical protein
MLRLPSREELYEQLQVPTMTGAEERLSMRKRRERIKDDVR